MMLSSDSLYKPERMTDLTSTQIGTVGEYLVASIMGGFGVDVTRSDASAYDILALVGNIPIRIDVKTTAKNTPTRGFWVKKGKTGKERPFDGGGCDLFAFVCLEDHAIFFDTCDKYVGKTQIKIKRDSHQDQDPYQTWLNAVGKILPQ